MRINIFTSYDKFHDSLVLADNDIFFDEYVKSSEFEDIDREVLDKVDGAVVIDTEIDTVKTKRGVCRLNDISTGCKTVLNYLYLCRNREHRYKALDITYCGANALEELFNVMEKKQYSIDLILMHKDEVFKCSNRDYFIDGRKQISNLLYM